MQLLNETERTRSIRRGRINLTLFIGIALVVLLVCFYSSKQHTDYVPQELIEPNSYPEVMDGKTL